MRVPICNFKFHMHNQPKSFLNCALHTPIVLFIHLRYLMHSILCAVIFLLDSHSLLLFTIVLLLLRLVLTLCTAIFCAICCIPAALLHQWKPNQRDEYLCERNCNDQSLQAIAFRYLAILVLHKNKIEINMFATLTKVCVNVYYHE